MSPGPKNTLKDEFRDESAGGTLWWMLDGFGGTRDFSFFRTPKWVDHELPPGHTSQAQQVNRPNWWMKYPTLSFLFYSPNIVWLSIAALTYLAFPPDFTSAETLQTNYVLGRVALHVGILNAYYGFWHVTMYVLRWGNRKFNNKQEGPSLARFIHNLWYAQLGAIQSGVWDALFFHMYASGKLPYVADSAVFADVSTLLKTMFWIAWAPAWRDLHFYLAHRFIHISFVYRYVHSLHHRNTDVEPYSGLTMHPIEHLYYFGCAFTTVYMHASPFIVYWCLIHALISPAASHSGWEDNFQSDQYHFLHHSKFECNYGTPGTPFDVAFGTFREKIGASSAYKGAGDSRSDDPSESGKYLRGPLLPSDFMYARSEQGVYDAISCVGLAFLLYAALDPQFGVQDWELCSAVQSPQIVAFLIACGPLLVAYAMYKLKGTRQSWRWPFHKDSLLYNVGPHLVVQVLCVVLPVYHTVETLLSKTPADTIYCKLHSC